TPNAWQFHFDLKFVFTVQWFSLGVTALSHLNWALYCIRFIGLNYLFIFVLRSSCTPVRFVKVAIKMTIARRMFVG
ncbi:hypothetical protein F0249_20205, partial [Vibrio sp. 03-59-1]|uniref:hypothetical protein n=1 Tax=Vibrio sp. 03-59-1 TaxID=2607607 RepID=UPI0016B1DFE7